MADEDKQELQNRLILEEIRTLQKRITSMETQIEAKIDRLSDMFRADHKVLEAKVHDIEVKHEVAIAVIKSEVTTRTAGIAFAISCGIAIVAEIIMLAAR
jgi:hypothetical protein